MKRIEEVLGDARTAVILGHIHPDGDCVGSCLGLYNYLRTVAPGLRTQVYLQEFSPNFAFLSGADRVSHDFTDGKTYDLCFALDSSDRERLGGAVCYLDTAKRRVCLDHHATNTGMTECDVICPDASSAAEVLTERMDPGRITKETAECLYLGIVHDTGVFKHSNTGKRTMELAGMLLAKGVSSARIIDDTFYKKTWAQNRIMGYAVMNSRLMLSGRLIAACVTGQDMEKFQVTTLDLDGIVDQLRVTEGVEAAIFLYETAPGEFKASMRSNELVDVSRIAQSYGGGGHVRAAGCSRKGDPGKWLLELAEQTAAQLDGQDKNGRNTHNK